MPAEQRQQKGKTATRRGAASTRRWPTIVALGLVLVPAMTTAAAFQDMASLLEGANAEARWQAYFVPSPAGAIAEAKLAYADDKQQQRLPAGSGVRGADGGLFSMDTVRPAFDTPDEARVARRDKSSRVITSAPVTPPKAFTAGSILERHSLLQPNLSKGDDAVRQAFLVPAPSADLIQVAMSFQPSRSGSFDAGASETMVASLDDTGTATALGYAAEERGTIATLFEKILKEPQAPFVPPLEAGDHAWAATPLPASAFSEREQTCLANGIYYEARGESELGQAAVGQVILNRVRNPSFPNTICGVVYQNKDWRNRCQFSFACDGRRDRVSDRDAWEIAKRVADQVSKGQIWINEVGSATHYHATYVKPRWARAMERVDRIGQHIFYRTFGGGWD
ncbi:cell wall hydrolase [Consotaella aegiceratis]|uniref:cell wall hydrolase n=1 Tax=Consotaella aegiceratis TaxID=3097961 RepID=UPI002F4118DD